MKIRSIISYATTVAALAGMPLLAPAQVSFQFGTQQQPPPPQYQQYQPNWNEDQRRELRHIFFQLERANTDYDGHRANALREIRRAAEDMGMDLHGAGYTAYGQAESQEYSDRVLRRSRDQLIGLANTTEQPVRHELWNAIRELDRALEIR